MPRNNMFAICTNIDDNAKTCKIHTVCNSRLPLFMTNEEYAKNGLDPDTCRVFEFNIHEVDCSPQELLGQTVQHDGANQIIF